MIGIGCTGDEVHSMNDTHPRERLRVTSPGDELLGCDEVDVGQGEDRVNELEETLLPVGPVEEPGSVEEEGEGGLALGVVLQEVLGEDLLDGVGVLGVEAAIRHGAGPAPEEMVAFSGYFYLITTQWRSSKERTSPIVESKGLLFVCCFQRLLSLLVWRAHS